MSGINKEMNCKGAIIIEGHVQGLSNTRSLGEAGIPVYVIDVNSCLARFSKYCKKFFVCPDFTSREFIVFLVNLAKKEGLEGWTLIPSNDHIVENLSNNLDTIRKFYKTIVPEPSILKNIIDKGRLIDIAMKCGTPVPVTLLSGDVSEKLNTLNYPVLIKGKAGLSFYKNIHAKAIQANSKEELINIIPDIKNKISGENILIQELIPYDSEHKVVSFTAFCIDGIIKAHWAGIKIREHPIKYGTATFAQSIYSNICYQQSVHLLENLNYTGVCEVEYLFDPRDGMYKLIEINPRTWLWVGLAKACGVNYALMVYNYLNSIPFEFPVNFKKDLVWINYFTDTIFSLKAIISGHIKTKDYIKSMFNRKINAIFSWRDIMPGLVFPLMVFYIAKKRA